MKASAAEAARGLGVKQNVRRCLPFDTCKVGRLLRAKIEGRRANRRVGPDNDRHHASKRVGAADVYVLGNLGVAETTGDLERVGERVIRLPKSCIASVGDVLVRNARTRRIDQSELLCLASLPPITNV